MHIVASFNMWMMWTLYHENFEHPIQNQLTTDGEAHDLININVGLTYFSVWDSTLNNLTSVFEPS